MLVNKNKKSVVSANMISWCCYWPIYFLWF